MINMYWTGILKKISYLAVIVLIIIASLKLSVFYMPFLIAFIIIHLISVIFNKLILLVLTLIAAILIKKIVKYEEDE